MFLIQEVCGGSAFSCRLSDGASAVGLQARPYFRSHQLLQMELFKKETEKLCLKKYFGIPDGILCVQTI